MSLKEPYIYCGICYKKCNERTLYLTSCAHVVCQDHINLQSKICPKCHVHDISIVKLEEGKFPASIKEIIEPSFEQLNNIQFASKFQYLQLKGLIEQYEHQNGLLKDKNSRLKDLLRKSRVELDKCNNYQREISRLREENERLSLKLQIGDHTTFSKDKVNDIDGNNEEDDDDINEISIDEYRSSSRSGEDFLNKLKKFNQLKNVEEIRSQHRESISSSSMKNKLNKNRGSNLNADLSSFNIQAESTAIKRNIKPIMSSSSSRNSRSNNNNSSNNSGNKRKLSTSLHNLKTNTDSNVNNRWYKKRNDSSHNSSESGNGSSILNSFGFNHNNNNNNNSSKTHSSNISGGSSGIMGNSKNLKKTFNFKPPSRSISTARSGIKIGLGEVLRSRSEIFKR